MDEYHPRFEYHDRGWLAGRAWIDYGDSGLGTSCKYDLSPKELEERINYLDKHFNALRQVTKTIKDEDVIAQKLMDLYQEFQANKTMSCGEKLLVQKIFDKLNKELLNGCTINITHYMTIANKEE